MRMQCWLLACFLLLFSAAQAQEEEEACPMSSNKKARKLFEKALDIVRSNKNEAKALLLEAIELDPEFAQANQVLGDLLVKSKKTSQAEEYYLRAIEICPDIDGMVYFRLGSIEFADRRYKEAQGHLRKFVESGKGKEAEQSDAR